MVATVLAIAGIMIIVLNWHPQDTIASQCAALSYLEKVPCHMNEVREAVDTGGIDGGFAYAESMQDQLDYSLNHFVMHEIGRGAYRILDGDIPLALRTQMERTSPTAFDYELDGYRHGLFEAFFAQNGTKEAAELATEICPTSLHTSRVAHPGIYTYPPDSLQQSDIDQNQCFHAIGHGLMYGNNNDIKLSLSQCDELPEDWQRQWCYYGAFMQHTYSDWPGYESELEPHNTLPEGMTMAQLCREIPERQHNACSRLAGRWYIGKSTKQTREERMEQVFGQCFAVEEKYQEACIIDTAGSSLPIVFPESPERSFEMCEVLFNDSDLQAACIFGVASGIKQGAGKFVFKNLDNVCELVDTKFEDACLRATGRGYTWF